jgi:hypothetical protein
MLALLGRELLPARITRLGAVALLGRHVGPASRATHQPLLLAG